ncbi:carboxymuconolactone decarboxylase family protein [Nocardia sp. NPDC005998]|uniref:carboxymuconolactone decarboxylase family protein n=1 Tax=Nocardia sp. NPDC005998 TaxID=3156894 RepID=UPI0033A9D476
MQINIQSGPIIRHLIGSKHRAIMSLRSKHDNEHPPLSTHVAQINGCVYCIDMHQRDAVAGGDSWRRVGLLPAWRESPSSHPASAPPSPWPRQ